VGACSDSGHGDESDARILEFLRDRVAEHGSDRLIDPTDSTAAHPIPPRRSSTEATRRSTRTPCGSCSSSQRCTLSAPPSRTGSEPPVSAAVSVERCHRSWWSVSETAQPKRWWSCALIDDSSLRLDFRLPASGKCRSITSTATKPPDTSRELALDLARRVGL